MHSGQTGERSKRTVEEAAYCMDAQVQLDFDDIVRQVDCYKAQGLIGKKIDSRNAVDLTVADAKPVPGSVRCHSALIGLIYSSLASPARS